MAQQMEQSDLQSQSHQGSVRMSFQPQKPTAAFVGASWVALFVGGFGIGLWNATLALSEKGFDAMAFLLGLFGAVAVQKNIRDLALFEPREAADRDTQSQQA
jgi:uncharacterized membrane protein YiaA